MSIELLYTSHNRLEFTRESSCGRPVPKHERPQNPKDAALCGKCQLADTGF